uniref:HPt domain-containing protein n=1 Tax=Trieres chinensis TaxID=1514140 RepID=A0A7S2A896_TRICV
MVKEKSPSATAGSFPKLMRKNTLAEEEPDDVESGISGDGAQDKGARGTATASDMADDTSFAISVASDARSIGDDEPPSSGPDDGCTGLKSRPVPREALVLQKLYDELGDISEFQDMCKLFIANVPAQLTVIDKLISQSDWLKLGAVLHTLKGTLQVFHLDSSISLMGPMYELCLTLAAREGKEGNGNETSPEVAAPTSLNRAAKEDEINQMKHYASQQRLGLGQVVGVCRGVLSSKDGE